jgi:hypothetical protein
VPLQACIACLGADALSHTARGWMPSIVYNCLIAIMLAYPQIHHKQGSKSIYNLNQTILTTNKLKQHSGCICNLNQITVFQGQARPKIVLKIDAKILGNFFFKFSFKKSEKRILENICKIWHLQKGNLPRVIIIWHCMLNLPLGYGTLI